MKYCFGKIKPGADACRLGALQNVEDDFELFKGISRLKMWPDDAYFPMDKSFPDEVLLEDFVFNTNGVLVVSQKIRNSLVDLELKGNEWLPVQIKNHKGRLEKQQYFILHQVQLQSCIDCEKSVVIENKINPDIFMRVMKLVIDETRISQDLKLFRMARYPYLAMFERELKGIIMEAEPSGIVFGEIEDWKGR